MSLIYAMKAGDNVATPFPGDASGLASALGYCGSNGHVLLPPGLSALSIDPPPGVTVCRVDGGVDQRFGYTAFHGGPWYDVRAFGATGDGSTDDTTAIQRAIDTAAEAGPGASVFFGPGTYRVTNGGLRCRRETWLVGLGTPILKMTSLSATLVTFSSLTIGAVGMGGGIRGISLVGAGGTSTSVGVSVGDPMDLDAWASHVSLVDCDIREFGYGVVLDGHGTLVTGENSSSDGFAIDHCLIIQNVYMGLLIKNTFAIEISQITRTNFTGNGTERNSGCAIGLSASGGGPRATAAANLSMFGCTINNNGNGAFGQIHVPTSAWIDLKLSSCSFEGGAAGQTNLAILSDGAVAHDGPRSAVRITNCIFMMLPAPTTRRESVVFGCGELQVTNSRFHFEAGAGVLAAIKAGVAGQYGSVSLIGNLFEAGGTTSNARVLDLTPANRLTNYFAMGNTFRNLSAASALVVNPNACLGSGDLLPQADDNFTGRRVAFHGLHLRSTTDPGIDVEFDVSSVGSDDQKLEVWNHGRRAFFRLPTVPTSSLPAPGATNDGKMFLEDNGSGDRNLVVYAGGQRFRIDGGTAF